MQADSFFSNPFYSTAIKPNRLYTFTEDAIGRLKGSNPNNAFNAIIAGLTTTSDAVGAELGEVQSTLAVQVGKTQTVNDVMKDFKTYMKDNEPFIAKALGGRKKAAFLEFYPSGLPQYSGITKTKIEDVLKQVFDAADKNKTALGTQQTKELKDFTKAYKDARKDQVEQKGTVSDNRTDKKDVVKELADELFKALCFVGYTFNNDMAKCCSYFNFSLLYSKGGGGKSKPLTPKGEVGIGK